MSLKKKKKNAPNIMTFDVCLLAQESGPVLDKLAGTLLPADFPDTKQRDSKPKVTLCLLDTLCTCTSTQMRNYKS